MARKSDDNLSKKGNTLEDKKDDDESEFSGNKNNSATKRARSRSTEPKQKISKIIEINTGISGQNIRKSTRNIPHKYIKSRSNGTGIIIPKDVDLKNKSDNVNQRSSAKQPRLLSKTNKSNQTQKTQKIQDKQSLSQNGKEIEKENTQIEKVVDPVTPENLNDKIVDAIVLEPEGSPISSPASPSTSNKGESSESEEDGSSEDEADIAYKRRRNRKTDWEEDMGILPYEDSEEYKSKRKSSKKKKGRKRSRSRSRSKGRSKKCRKKMSFEDEIESNPKVKELMKQVAEMAEQIKCFQKGNTGTTSISKQQSEHNSKQNGKELTPTAKKNTATGGKRFTPLKSPSDSSIYVPAVKLDENLQAQLNQISKDKTQEGDFDVQMINDYIHQIRLGVPSGKEETVSIGSRNEPRPSTSRGPDPQPGGSNRNPDDIAAETIRQAEQFKATIQPPPRGMNFENMNNLFSRILENDDDEFFHIACHIEQTLREKIKKGHYVELDKLLQKPDALNYKKQNALQMVYQDGQQIWVPAVDKSTKIDGIRKWEQAFRIYAAIYCQENPHRSIEILQYIDTINKAAKRFTWDSVAHYDYIVRHLQATKPNRNWGKTYTQMWNLTLVANDQYRFGNQTNFQNDSRGHGSNNVHATNGSTSKKSICWRYNKGSCTYGKDCKFKHECSYCGKQGHGYHNCRKRTTGKKNHHENNKSPSK